MIGLGYVVFFGLYLYLTVKAIRLTVKWTKKRNKFAYLWGTLVGIGMLAIIFWDVIPVYSLHRKLCGSDAGFVIYKTLEEWGRENPGVIETLSPSDSNAVSNGNTMRFGLNQRFVMEVTRNKIWYMLEQKDQRVVDTVTGEVMAQYIDYYTNLGNPFAGGPRTGLRDYKGWMQIPSCENLQNMEEQIRFNGFKQSIDLIGGE